MRDVQSNNSTIIECVIQGRHLNDKPLTWPTEERRKLVKEELCFKMSF